MMTKFRKTILFGFFLALVSAPALADQGPSKEESIGISMGALIGGAAGGPVGALLGAAFGAKFGDELHERDLQVQSLNVSLVSSKERIVTLQRNIVALRDDLESKGRELNDLQELARPELLALLEAPSYFGKVFFLFFAPCLYPLLEHHSQLCFFIFPCLSLLL